MRLTGECPLARPVQGFDGWGRTVFLWLSLSAAVPLAGCGSRGISIEDAVPDAALTTGSITRSDAAYPDASTIRDAVSSAVVEEIGEAGIGWANVGTGSRGVIRDVSERRDNGVICRSFAATHESYEGVHLYRGETCLGSEQRWAMQRFDRVE